MVSHLIRIGNSRGIRIPKAIQDQIGLRDEVHLEVRGNELVVRAAQHPRTGWEDAFRKMAERGDDKLLDDGGPGTQWDRSEWEW